MDHKDYDSVESYDHMYKSGGDVDWSNYNESQLGPNGVKGMYTRAAIQAKSELNDRMNQGAKDNSTRNGY